MSYPALGIHHARGADEGAYSTLAVTPTGDFARSPITVMSRHAELRRAGS